MEKFGVHMLQRMYDNNRNMQTYLLGSLEWSHAAHPLAEKRSGWIYFHRRRGGTGLRRWRGTGGQGRRGLPVGELGRAGPLNDGGLVIVQVDHRWFSSSSSGLHDFCDWKLLGR